MAKRGRAERTKMDGHQGAKPRRSWRRRLMRGLLAWGLVLGVWVLIAVGLYVGYCAYTLPDVDGLAESVRKPSVTLTTADGRVFATFGDLYGEAVQVGELPAHVPAAVLAVEDRRFYEHGGVDLWGILRAAVVNLVEGQVVQGGSTITQQLAKNVFLSHERTVKRKVQEILLALWLERTFTKDQILTLYLNRVYFGAGTYGVDAAARRFFGKPATAMDLFEAAMLAGLLRAPSRYNPARDPDLAAERARLVLVSMVEAGFIADADARTAARRQQGFAKIRIEAGGARYFADWVMSRVPSFVGQPNRDLVVKTTLDLRLQRTAEIETEKMLVGAAAERKVEQAALVALDPSGAVRAMVGGRDYGTSQFNRATQALRQPGSAFKAFVFLAGFEAGLAPDTKIKDAPVKVGKWAPSNYKDKYYGSVTLREAFARSLNSVAVRIGQQVGAETVAASARRLGVAAPFDPPLSIALGTFETTLYELTGAYATFANSGIGVWPYAIEEIRDADGALLYRREGTGPGQVVKARSAAQMNDVLHAVVEWGTGKQARIEGEWTAGKTGTSQDFRDAWFIGFTPRLITGVWMGNDDGRPMSEVAGGTLPAELWYEFASRAITFLPDRAAPSVAVAAPAPAPAAQPATESGGGGILKSLFDRVRRELAGDTGRRIDPERLGR